MTCVTLKFLPFRFGSVFCQLTIKTKFMALVRMFQNNLFGVNYMYSVSSSERDWENEREKKEKLITAYKGLAKKYRGGRLEHLEMWWLENT